ncbi:hypothetical protein FQR65_LT20116 [Abscondita terminalis]|nr:hypothetical protein FQR65_LT20116 [Abscondita terminalis]
MRRRSGYRAYAPQPLFPKRRRLVGRQSSPRWPASCAPASVGCGTRACAEPHHDGGWPEYQDQFGEDVASQGYMSAVGYVPISWASTAFKLSSGGKTFQKTLAEPRPARRSWFQPVAQALASRLERMPTSGILMPASRDSCSTYSFFAIHLEMNSENREPATNKDRRKPKALIEVEITPLAAMNPLKRTAQSDAGNQHNTLGWWPRTSKNAHMVVESPVAKT